MTLVPIEDLPIWTFRPNWSGGVTERLEWLTDVLPSRVGAEQRRGLRLSPRRSLEFQLLLHGEERTFFDLMLQALGSSDFSRHCPAIDDTSLLTTSCSGKLHCLTIALARSVRWCCCVSGNSTAVFARVS